VTKEKKQNGKKLLLKQTDFGLVTVENQSQEQRW
jgi:hypothetical protein